MSRLTFPGAGHHLEALMNHRPPATTFTRWATFRLRFRPIPTPTHRARGDRDGPA